MANNLFDGSIPQCLRSSIGDLKELVLLNNSFSGVIPDEIYLPMLPSYGHWTLVTTSWRESFQSPWSIANICRQTQRQVSIMVRVAAIITCSHPEIKWVLWTVVSSPHVHWFSQFKSHWYIPQWFYWKPSI